MDLNVGDGHVDVGREDGEQQQGEAPPGEKLDAARRNQQPEAAEQFPPAADEDAGAMERNPRWHDRQEKARIVEVNESGKEK